MHENHTAAAELARQTGNLQLNEPVRSQFDSQQMGSVLMQPVQMMQ